MVRKLSEGNTNLGFNREERAFNLLAQFQLIEFSLKFYIGIADEIIRCRVTNIIPYRDDGGSLDKAPLERLLKLFKRINGNDQLQKNIALLIDRRNEIAHRMLLPHVGISRRDEDWRGEHQKLRETEQSVEHVMKALAKEIRKIKKAHSVIVEP